MKRRLILLRHGETQYNIERRMQGQLDIELTENGKEQARKVAPVIAAQKPFAIYSSDSSRAAVTARAVGELAGVEVQLDKRLRETDMGEWAGLPHTEVEEGWPGQRLKWRATPTYAPPGGENRIELAERVAELVRELIPKHPEWGEDDRPLLLVSHGGTICALAAALLDFPLQNYALLSAIGNTAWAQLTEWPAYVTDAELDADPLTAGPRHRAVDPIHPGYQWRLDIWNNTAHLSEEPIVWR
ncbi:MAG TPA: histidine phosphatase family protein [Corynebacteriales bacterium]|nr:histidine phosphatase family protein [Mycobacteriales bacterium]